MRESVEKSSYLLIPVHVAHVIGVESVRAPASLSTFMVGVSSGRPLLCRVS